MDLQIPKERWQSDQYYKWINRQQCVRGCKRGGSVHAHHSISRKWVEGSDSILIPLCDRCHRDELHASGVGTVEWLKSHGLNFDRIVTKLHEKFIREHELVWNQILNPTFESLLDSYGLNKRYSESKKVNRVYKWQDSPKRFVPLEERGNL